MPGHDTQGEHASATGYAAPTGLDQASRYFADDLGSDDASRYVYRNARSYIQETVVEWDEGHGFLIRLHRGDKPAPPFRNAWFRYRLVDEGPDKTLFSASLEYELPWGALGRWLEKRMEKIVQATINDVALAMKLYYETGQPTTAAALQACKRRA